MCVCVCDMFTRCVCVCMSVSLVITINITKSPNPVVFTSEIYLHLYLIGLTDALFESSIQFRKWGQLVPEAVRVQFKGSVVADFGIWPWDSMGMFISPSLTSVPSATYHLNVCLTNSSISTEQTTDVENLVTSLKCVLRMKWEDQPSLFILYFQKLCQAFVSCWPLEHHAPCRYGCVISVPFQGEEFSGSKAHEAVCK